jgi:hypothetical protein
MVSCRRPAVIAGSTRRCCKISCVQWVSSDMQFVRARGRPGGSRSWTRCSLMQRRCALVQRTDAAQMCTGARTDALVQRRCALVQRRCALVQRRCALVHALMQRTGAAQMCTGARTDAAHRLELPYSTRRTLRAPHLLR